MVHPTRTTETRKRTVSCKTKTKQRLTFFDIVQTFTGMNEILESILTETNRYATQKSCNFETTEAEMQINFIMGINKLRSMEDY